MHQILNFSIPIMKVICDWDFSTYTTLLELEERIKLDIDNVENHQYYGARSADTYLLDKSEYRELKNWIEFQLNYYCRQLLGWRFDKISITQSWVSIKNPGQEHKLHSHPNSLVSGVFYWQDGVECMYLKRPTLPTNFQIAVDNFNEYSNDWIEIVPEKGLLCLFPSYLEHCVQPNNSSSARYCLPFNSIIFEKLGYDENLTGLDLRKSL
jgi:uncharacterized protein (TIGR02466 family)